MRRAVLVVVAAVVCWPAGSSGQSTPIALTDKIASLEGVWIHDPTKGVRGSCVTPVDQPERTIRMVVSAQGVDVESERLKKLLPLDGSPVPVRDSTVAAAALDAGWLTITIRVIAPGGRGATNVHRDVYVVNGDELTIWRNFTIEWPDGSLSSTVCSYRQALVYQRSTREAR
jgi:hypothetical protein